MSVDNEDYVELNHLISLSQEHSKNNSGENDYPLLDSSGFGALDDDDVISALSEEYSEDEDFDFEIPPQILSDSDIVKIKSSAPPQLSPSERETVDICKDPHLKELLLMNRTKGGYFKQLWSFYNGLLKQTEKELAMTKQSLIHKSEETKSSTKFYKIGIPYFKSKDGFPCPRNPDAIAKYNKRQIFHYDMTPSVCWNDTAIYRLIEAVKFQYRTNRVSELQKEINKLNFCESTDKKTIKELRHRCEAIEKDRSSHPPLGSDKYIDWHKVSTKFLWEKFSEEDCRIFWNTYAHPTINKKPWSKNELGKLTRIANKHKRQNWDKIAEELGRNRTDYLACVKFFSSSDRQNKVGKFTGEEDEKLLNLIETYRNGSYIPWSQIARSFKRRTREQIFFRYTYFLKEKGNISRERFTEAEDVLLLILVERYGPSFSKCAKHFPNRSAMQLKARYTSNLKMPIKKFAFSAEVDEAIMKHVEQYGPQNWNVLGSKIHRTSQQIIQRYKLLESFKAANPDANIVSAPRRVRYSKTTDKGLDYLLIIADYFKNREKIPPLEEIQMLLDCEKIQHTRRYSQKNIRAMQDLNEITEDETSSNTPEVFAGIDDLIIDFFYDIEKEKAAKEIIKDCLPELSGTVKELLNTLQVNLNIPKNFENHPELDDVDKEIIKNLIEHQQTNMDDEFVVKCDEQGIKEVVPPSLHTLVGYRGLLALEDEFRNELAKSIGPNKPEGANELEAEVDFCISGHVSNLLSPVGDKIRTARDKFAMRLYSIFKFPMLMSETPPETIDESTNENTNSPENPRPFECVFLKDDFHVRSEPKTSIAEKLKRKIDESIKKLSEPPAKKKFYTEIEAPRKSAPILKGTKVEEYFRNELRDNKLNTRTFAHKDPLLFKTYSKKKAPETIVKIEDDEMEDPAIDAPAQNAEETLCEMNVEAASPFVTGSLETDLQELAALDKLLNKEKTT